MAHHLCGKRAQELVEVPFDVLRVPQRLGQPRETAHVRKKHRHSLTVGWCRQFPKQVCRLLAADDRGE